MNRFEIILGTNGTTIRAEGSSKAALLLAALQGLSAVAKPKSVPDAEPVERPFSIRAKNYQDLLVALLNDAVSLSEAHHETYDGIRFALITDTQAEGVFHGKPVEAFDAPATVAAEQNLDLKRRDDGVWQATVGFNL